MVSTITTHDIFCYIPNIIGYVRVATAIVSFFTMKEHPYYTSVLYGVSSILDAFDGYAARKFNQGTRFGAVLDMVTDRCATSSLIVFLAVLYPQYYVAWQVLVSLDLASHYVHMYSSLASGSTSHKNVDGQSKLLQLYYTNRTVLFIVCAFNELFYFGLYLHYFNFAIFGTGMTVVSTPFWIFKQVANVIQLKNASVTLAELDAKDRNKQQN
ncbi:CDP-diacylglycerol--inositol 3-phosphatidyltransferase [Diutina rugosa]